MRTAWGAVLLGLIVALFPFAALLATTSGLAPAPTEPDAPVLVAGAEGTGDGRAGRPAAPPTRLATASSGQSWIHGLPPLPREPATPTPGESAVGDAPEAPAEEEISPEELARVEGEARAAVAAEAGRSVIPGAPPPGAGPSSTLGAAVPASARRWESQISKAAAKYGLDPSLLAALIMTESGGDPRIVSPKGAVGLTQVMGGSPDPDENVNQGSAILARHLAHYGRLDLALAAYNAGPGAVNRYGGVPPFRETRDHVFRVLLRLELYRSR